MKLLTDVHTHTTFSTDGVDTIFDMLAKAKELNLAYWGISEHFDYDYLVDGVTFNGEPAKFTDADAYFTTAKKLRAETADLRILVGGEFGFTRNEKALPLYHALIERYQPDFVVNSVHTQGKYDWYEKIAFAGKDKQTAYGEYLALVRDSLDVSYHYDIVGHIGYACRFAPYEDRVLYLDEFQQQIDDILKTVIKKDKILEVNSSVKGLDTPFLPFVDVVKRYFELGGRNVSFASDAHATTRLLNGRENAVTALKNIGFTHITVPCKGEKIKIEL